MNEPAPLPDDLLDHLEAAREVELPASGTTERIFARLTPFLPLVDGTAGGSTGAPPGESLPGAASTASVASAAASGAWKGKLLLAAVSAAVGAGGGAVTHATFGTPRPVPVFVAAPMARALAVPMDRARAAATARPSAEAAPPPPVPPPVTPPVASASSEEPAPRRTSLREERLLLEAANAALLRGEHASAIASLRKHARSYPKGELAQEREVLLVQALRASGNDTAAEQKAKAFKQKFPDSMQQGSVDKGSGPR